MHAGARQQDVDEDLPIGDIQVELIATPVILLTSAVGLHAQRTLLRQGGQHLQQALVTLSFNQGAPLSGLGSLVETALGFPASPRFGLLVALRSFRKTLAAFDGCRVAYDVTHQSAAFGGFYDRGMEAFAELLVGELREGAQKGAFARQLRVCWSSRTDGATVRLAGGAGSGGACRAGYKSIWPGRPPGSL